MFGEPVTNQWGTWDVQEQYWAFSPCLATNVPDRAEVLMDSTNMSFIWTIVIRNETTVPFDMRGLKNTTCTWWEDDVPEVSSPFNSYHITNWIDSNNDTITNPSDYLFINDYWWAPTVPEEVALKGCGWWHVVGVTWTIDGDMIWRLTLEYVSKTFFDPTDPECTWFRSLIGPVEGNVYHINGWVDNNADGEAGYCDVIYLEEYENVTMPWGWTLLPMTKRTWHVLGVEYGSTVVLHLHRFYYDFQIRTTDPSGNPIYFVDAGGNIVDVFDIHDVEYSLKRGLVQDQYGSPMWKFYKPLFDQMNSDFWDTGDPTDAIELAYLIEDAIEIVSLDPPVLRINMGVPFPDTAFKQIMCGTWASIVSREYSLSIGCWGDNVFFDVNQNCYPDWFEYGSTTVVWWRHIHDSPYDILKAYCGTGPYRVVVFDEIARLVVLERNAIYWRGWPASCRVGYLEYIDIEYVPDLETLLQAFVACQIDICEVPRSLMMMLLDPADPARMTTLYPEIKTIKNLAPVLQLEAIFYTFTLNPESPAIYTGSFPNGIPYNFFNNTHVRRAFSYTFNHSRYLRDAWLGEAICRETPDIYCLTPDYYTYGPDPPWTYDVNITNVIEELQAAMFTQLNETSGSIETHSIWDWGGFRMGAYCCTGNPAHQLIIEQMREIFNYINAAYGKSFIVESPQLVDWPTYLEMLENSMMPFWIVMSGKANYADADIFKREFMHSWGDFAYFQNYTEWNGWCGTLGPQTGLTKDMLIDLAVKTPDGPERARMYADLDDIFVMDCPSLPIAQPVERKWLKYWVRGWYYNALYPSDYYYKLFKMNTCWADVTGVIPGKPDGVCSMRDIGYIAGHFGAVAPNPHRAVPYDPKWAPGTYGCGGCDLYGDRKIDMRDIGFACAHFGDTTEP